MKKILITGANSYIGVSFENYMKKWAEEYTVDTVDMIDGSWKEKDFSSYDAVFHVAGIAHKKETKENAHLYYTVNRDLVIETAKKRCEESCVRFFPNADKLQIETYFTFITGGCIALMERWLKDGMKESSEMLAAAAEQIMEKGLGFLQ